MREFKIRPKFGERLFILIEEINGIKLSKEFKEIMTKYSGSCIFESYFEDIHGCEWELGAFDNFPEIYKLTKQFKISGKGSKVPFAHDKGGWNFCLSFDEESYGKIIVYRWTNHAPKDEFLIISNSFEEFINGLRTKSENIL